MGQWRNRREKYGNNFHWKREGNLKDIKANGSKQENENQKRRLDKVK